MITVNYIGRRGNGMFQYAFGRILQQKTWYKLQGFNQNRDLESTYNLPVPFGAPYFEGQHDFPNAPEEIHGVIGQSNFIIEDEYIRDQIAHHPHSSIISDIKQNNGCTLHGFFQFQEIYRPYREELKQIYYIPNFPEEENDWAFHVRNEDYTDENRIPISYYESVVRKYNINNFSFIGKDLRQDYMDALISMGGEYVNFGSSIDDFRFLKSHRHIAIPNSSFGWWAGFLSDAETVVVPLPSMGYWSKGSMQDLFIPDSNMVQIEC